jgi:hypothetical protein
MEDLEKLQKFNTNLQLKLEHYKQRLTEKEDQIADHRVEITHLQDAVRQLVAEREARNSEEAEAEPTGD